MVAIVTFVAGLAMVGGVAANGLLLFSLIGVALGGQGSHVNKNRRLPQDSEVKVFRLLFLIGALIGCAFACIGGPAEWFFAFPTAVAAFTVGSIVAYRTCIKLNDAYLVRAYECMESGDYRGAIEDAKEVARSSEALRSEANEIVSAAQELQRQQPLDIPDKFAATEESTGLTTAALMSR